MQEPAKLLVQLVDTVRASRKYRTICEDLIRSIGCRELAKQQSLKKAIKSTKNKLHQIGGAYLFQNPDYASWIDQIRGAHRSSREAVCETCLEIMQYHASTRERLPILERFYTDILSQCGPVHSVLDVACGLNPLAIPWMPLAADIEYYARDIYQDMVDFINAFLNILDIEGFAQICDVTQASLDQPVDVALILKVLPCLDQVDRSASLRLLESIRADYLVVSFPVHSLGGGKKGMVTNYEFRFRDLIAKKNWAIQRFEFPTELAFLITRNRGS